LRSAARDHGIIHTAGLYRESAASLSSPSIVKRGHQRRIIFRALVASPLTPHLPGL
jgi:hypothetical protein